MPREEDPHMDLIETYLIWFWRMFGHFLRYLGYLWYPVLIERIGPGLDPQWNYLYYLYRDFLVRVSLYGTLMWVTLLRLTYLFAELDDAEYPTSEEEDLSEYLLDEEGRCVRDNQGRCLPRNRKSWREEEDR